MFPIVNVLDTYSFIKLATGKISIPDKIEILIPSSVLSDLAYFSYMRRKEVDLILFDLKKVFQFQSLDENIFYNQYYIKTQIEFPTKKIRDNYILPFALAIEHKAKIYTSKYMKDRLYEIGDEMDIVTT